MLIAVLSDCHDNIWNLERALPKLSKAEAVIFCGDFCAPFTLRKLAEGFTGPIHAVFGNNDGDISLLLSVAGQAGNATLYQPLCDLELGGRHIAAVHYPQLGEALALSGKYDAVFNGHTHVAQAKTIGSTLWANPGEMMGLYGKSSFGLYNTSTNTFEIQEIN